MDQLLIPDRIKVGFDERDDTYTKKLAYVIYYDKKGVLRKEASWENWRDKKIDPQEFDNVPTEGFVLNKKAGGYSSGWNHRQTYCRVYDPRGFEFEIDIPNLLFILQETSSFKGKGLEGEFVYAWQGKDLVLLPVGCEDYKKSKGFTELQAKKISAKSLIPGCSYKTKRQEDLIYLGKFNWYTIETPKNSRSWQEKTNLVKKIFVFVDNKGNFHPWNSISNLALQNSDIPVSNFAELMENFSKTKFASPVKKLEFINEPLDLNPERHYWGLKVFNKNSEEEYTEYVITRETKYNHQTNKSDLLGYRYTPTYKITFKDGVFEKKYIEQPRHSYYSWEKPKEPIYTEEEILAMGFQMLYVVLENGVKLKVDQI